MVPVLVPLGIVALFGATSKSFSRSSSLTPLVNSLGNTPREHVPRWLQSENENPSDPRHLEKPEGSILPRPLFMVDAISTVGKTSSSPPLMAEASDR